MDVLWKLISMLSKLEIQAALAVVPLCYSRKLCQLLKPAPFLK